MKSQFMTLSKEDFIMVVIIININIIIGRTALFESQSSLEDSARLHSVFPSLDLQQ
jgi:hypothetical protein